MVAVRWTFQGFIVGDYKDPNYGPLCAIFSQDQQIIYTPED